MQQFNLQKAIQYYEESKSISGSVRKVCNELNIPFHQNYRKRLSKYVNSSKYAGFDGDLETTTNTHTGQYANDKSKNVEVFMPSAWDNSLQRFLDIDEYCDKYGLPKEQVRSSKLVSHNSAHMVYNIAFYTPEEEAVLDIEKHLDEIIPKYIKPLNVRVTNTTWGKSDWFDRLVFTDVHLAMDVQGDGDPLYDGKWDKEESLDRLSQMIKHTLWYRKGQTLYIDNLGDFLDGLGGETTRKGHKLPQNMNDKEAFDLALEFSTTLVDSLVPYYEKVVYNIITNDNHSGVFGYFAAAATKKILEQKYPDTIQINVIKRFIDYYSVGKHTFVLTHGKDQGEQKFGLKPKLDAVQAEKIDQFCKENKLYNGNYIEVSKGDSHQALYDDTTSKDFQYYNYPAFSPPSNWVKTNFGNSKSGFRLYNILKEDNIKIAIPYWF